MGYRVIYLEMVVTRTKRGKKSLDEKQFLSEMELIDGAIGLPDVEMKELLERRLNKCMQVKSGRKFHIPETDISLVICLGSNRSNRLAFHFTLQLLFRVINVSARALHFSSLLDFLLPENSRECVMKNNFKIYT